MRTLNHWRQGPMMFHTLYKGSPLAVGPFCFLANDKRFEVARIGSAGAAIITHDGAFNEYMDCVVRRLP